MEILNRYTGEVLFSSDNANLCDANLCDADLCGASLRGADLRGADLCGASLCGADLCGASLRGASLRGADLCDANLCDASLCDANLWDCAGNRSQIKSIFISDVYAITYTNEVLQIGCENHKISDWWEFSDKQIIDMDGKTALKFWRKNKSLIKQIIEANPAKPTYEVKQSENN